MANSISKELTVRKDLLALSSKERAKFFDEYRDSIDLGNGIPSSTSFDTYASKRISSSDGFSKIKAPDGKTLSEKLKADPQAAAETKQARESISNALKLTDATKQGRKDFVDNLEALNTVIKKDPPTFNSNAIASYLQTVKGEAVTAIKNQHTQEKDNLTLMFADTTFQGNFKTSMGLDDTQFEEVKKEMLETLKKSQEAELKKFEESIEESVKNLLADSQKEFNRLSFLGDRYTRDKAMRDEINALAQKNKANANIPVSVAINGDEGNAIFKGIKVQDLNVIHTITGRPIVKNDDGSYSMELNRLFQTRASTYEDLASLAQTVKACGHEYITMEVNYKDPQAAAELGRLAYESAIVAGFDPKKITIKVNGEVKMQYDEKAKKQNSELFKEHPTRLQIANEKATNIANNVKAHLDDPTAAKAEVAKLKEVIHNMRNQTATPGTPTPPNPAPTF